MTQAQLKEAVALNDKMRQMAKRSLSLPGRRSRRQHWCFISPERT